MLKKKKRTIVYSKDETLKVPSPKKPKVDHVVGGDLQTIHSSGEGSHFVVVYAPRSNKKHKNFKDGFAVLSESKCIVYDETRKVVVRCNFKKESIEFETEINMGDKIVMFVRPCTKSTFEESTARNEIVTEAPILKSELKCPKKTGPLHKANSKMGTILKSKKLTPKYDPYANSATILYEPPQDTQDTVHVVLEPYLADKMRPHQKEGVRFMYECVTDMRTLKDGSYVKGCILADTMGIGKTFQSIALMRTLLTQSPLGFRKPHASRIIVVTPSSLVKQWVNEIYKWLGKERIQVTWIGEDSKKETVKKIETFLNSPLCPLLIISYDQIRIHVDLLRTLKFDLMVCDEGHKLKNPDSLIIQCLASLKCEHRTILTGTPFQNNLDEYYTLVNFVNPGCLGALEHFRSYFERPISKLKDKKSTHKALEEGLRKTKELNDIVSTFMLRRSSKVLENFLPSKTEKIIFCKPTNAQRMLYQKTLNSLDIDSLVLSGMTPLSAIMKLSKICNHPELLLPKDLKSDQDDFQKKILKDMKDLIPNFKRGDYASDQSGKFIALERILDNINNLTSDKVVIASSFTRTLDIVELILQRKGMTFVRLDGSTKVAQRQYAVDTFQKEPSCFAFILSTKAGAIGLNLFAANRLIMLDGEWNPSYDVQAQARVWRDGQTKETFIYRLLATGMIDEKIFQRQILKTQMSRSVVDVENIDYTFSTDDLEDLFGFDPDTVCETEELVKLSGEDDKFQFKHLRQMKDSEDYILSNFESPCSDKSDATDIDYNNVVSFVYYKKTKPMDQ